MYGRSCRGRKGSGCTRYRLANPGAAQTRLVDLGLVRAARGIAQRTLVQPKRVIRGSTYPTNNGIWTSEGLSPPW